MNKILSAYIKVGYLSPSPSSFHRLDMTLAVAEALNPNKPNQNPHPTPAWTYLWPPRGHIYMHETPRENARTNMSASMMNICRLRILQYCMVLHLIAVCPSSFEHQYTLLPRDVHKILDKACFIADLRPLTDESKSVPEASLFSQLTAIYDEDEHVVIGSIELDNFTWPSGARRIVP